MSTPPLSAKRRATRQAISDAATRLFIEKGFDQVTVDEIADAAGVGRMTVFSYFPRKDDMFFDLDEYGRADLLQTLEDRDQAQSPIEALRKFAHRIVEQELPYLSFSSESLRFIDTIKASEALKARARAIRDEITLLLAKALSDSVGRRANDRDAQVAAAHLITTWGLAFIHAHEAYRKSRKIEEAQNTFLTIIDQGALGLHVMLAGTPYAK